MGTDARQHLIASATALLAEEGVEAVTLRRIARAAGVSHGAPLRHFAGIGELLSAVASTGFDELRRRGEAPEGTTARDRLGSACRSYLGYALANPAMFELMFRRDLVGHDSGDVFTGLSELVRAAQSEGLRPAADPRLLTASLWSALHGLAGLWLAGPLGESLHEHELAEALELTLDAYLG